MSTPDAPASAGSASEFGRVDADGTVWVRTSDGERLVGSYPGSTSAEALAYFTRKYDELAGQVGLLEQRVRSTDLPAADAMATVDRLREAVATASAVGDLDGLRARLDGLVGVVSERRAEQDAARLRAREAARGVKERIAAEAESLAESSDWKRTGDRFRTLLEEWKAAPRLDRRVDHELWKRFSTARTAFDKRRRHHFAGLDAQRQEVRDRKERLVEEAESLSSSTDWAPTAARYRDLMTEWKAAGRASREAEETLWSRFRAAQDAFFAARSGVFADRDAGERANQSAKEALLAEAEAIRADADPRAARAALRGVLERWESVGHVPRDAKERLEGRLRRVEDGVRRAEEAQWRRSNPEARARAEATVTQLLTSIERLQKDLARAQASGQEGRVAEAEAAIQARQSWLAEAERTLAEFSPASPAPG